MTISRFLAGAAVLTMFVAPTAFTPAYAAEYAGGAIKTMTINGADVLTDAKGMTLYTFDKDKAGVSNCYDKCAMIWPPELAATGATANGDFTLIDRKDGAKAWAYMEMPLYLFAKDTKPGDTSGDGVGNVWHTAIMK